MIEFANGSYDWRELSLMQFLDEGHIPSSWVEFFTREDVKSELKSISEFLQKDVEKGTIVYPAINHVFRAFTPLKKLKFVLLGMDPYHNGSAIGLCFSVKPGNRINPSLKNIYRELANEGYTVREDGDLTHWAKQGCFMLNTALTVRKSHPDSHTKIWSKFTEKIILYVAEKRPDLVWVLMGSKADAFRKYIPNRAVILTTSHPSPFSAHKPYREHPAFLGSGIFRKINENLNTKITW